MPHSYSRKHENEPEGRDVGRQVLEEMRRLNRNLTRVLDYMEQHELGECLNDLADAVSSVQKVEAKGGGLAKVGEIVRGVLQGLVANARKG